MSRSNDEEPAWRLTPLEWIILSVALLVSVVASIIVIQQGWA